tara:strand:+ start:633 stop:1340 length:708 start_codon:yes stop_codon:yes gene_type:complete
MKIYWVILPVISFVLAHDSDKENIQWVSYYRLGTVYSKAPTYGVAGYARLKRTTRNTFNDLRLFTHIFEKDSEIRIRNKSSRRFLSLNQFYSFNTLIYERNTIIDVNLRYHYNQGIGYIIKNTDKGNITLETGIAFDNSDYLNTEQKTTYLRGASSIDQEISNLSLKFEIDYYYQVSKIIDGTNLSRFQILTEARWNLKKKIGIITGFTCDIHDNNPDPSFFLTIAFSDPINWKI